MNKGSLPETSATYSVAVIIPAKRIFHVASVVKTRPQRNIIVKLRSRNLKGVHMFVLFRTARQEVSQARKVHLMRHLVIVVDCDGQDNMRRRRRGGKRPGIG